MTEKKKKKKYHFFHVKLDWELGFEMHSPNYYQLWNFDRHEYKLKIYLTIVKLAFYIYTELNNISQSYIRLKLYLIMAVTLQSCKAAYYSLLLWFGYPTTNFEIIKLLHVLLHRSCYLSKLLQINICFLKISFREVLLKELFFILFQLRILLHHSFLFKVWDAPTNRSMLT